MARDRVDNRIVNASPSLRAASAARTARAGRWLTALGLVVTCSAWAAAPARLALEPGHGVHHDLEVTLDPARSWLEVEDRVTLPATTQALVLGLSAAFDIVASDPALAPTPAGAQPNRTVYRARLPPGRAPQRITLRYRGSVPNDPDRGILDPRGVYLDGAAGWVPRLDDRPFTFELTVRLPHGWQAVSQGRRVDTGAGAARWQAQTPQWEVYLVGGPLVRHRERGAGPTKRTKPELSVYLGRSEPALARRYLERSRQYLTLYERLVGPYPYPKFAVVESFWEIGYGMPSFTLMGSRVLRLPFVLARSLPHEILHNWWGNGVRVAPGGGNWSEGLTAYLADHLVEEREGRGAVYRRDVLQRYRSYVGAARDFPLAEFRGGHGQPSQAVGYGKALMLFHMLRRRLGDDRFLAGLARFYREHRFRRAGYADLRAALEAASGQSLGPLMAQWTERAGAPEITLGAVDVRASGAGYRLRGVVEQTQTQAPFALSLPLVVELEGKRGAEPALVEHAVVMTGRRSVFAIDLPRRPLRLLVDPAFDVFRRLAEEEVPPSLGELFGREDVLVVLPAGATPDPLVDAYRRMAAAWSARYGWRVADHVADPPAGAPRLRLGWENHEGAWPGGTEGDGLHFEGDPGGSGSSLLLHGRRYGRPRHSAVLVGRADGRTEAWIGGGTPAAVAVLTTKLPHYGRYSYLVFEGKAALNVVKGQWPVADSPLHRRLVDRPLPAPSLPPRPSLAAARGAHGD